MKVRVGFQQRLPNGALSWTTRTLNSPEEAIQFIQELSWVDIGLDDSEGEEEESGEANDDGE